MSRTAGKLPRLPVDSDEEERHLRKPQRSLSVSPQLRSRIQPTTLLGASRDAGAVDEEQFRLAFETFKPVSFQSGSELEKGLMDIHNVLTNPQEDWERRVDQLKRFRGYLVAGASSYDQFPKVMRYLEVALRTSARDLRSSVVREACISIAFLAETTGLDCERTAEFLLPTLILLIPNSAKVMSSSGLVAIRILLTNVHSQKLIPVITQECLSSKSKETRRACSEFVGICLSTFNVGTLERHVAGLRETIKTGISDADSDVRLLARRNYTEFAQHFPGQARDLYRELDVQKQRQLSGPQNPHPVSAPPVTPASFKSKPIPKSKTVNFNTNLGHNQPGYKAVPSAAQQRSASAVDAGAARRARVKLQPDPGYGRGAITPMHRLFAATDKRHLPAGNHQKPLSTEQNLRSTQVVTDIPRIVAALGSSNFLTKRDGLEALRDCFDQGEQLMPSELELLRSSFTRLIAESSPKVAVLVLDALLDFIRIHNLQIGSWLYELLAKLWSKQGSEASSAVDLKLERVLVLIRGLFPAQAQFVHVMRFISELPHTAPARTKLAALDFLTALINGVPLPGDDLKSSSVTRLGITKVITWCSDGKSEDLRQSSQRVLVLLNQLNCEGFVGIINSIDRQLRDEAIRMVNAYPRRPSAGSQESLGLPEESDLNRERTIKKSQSAQRSSPSPDGRQRVLLARAKEQRPHADNDENVNPLLESGGSRSTASPGIFVSRSTSAVVPNHIQDDIEEQVRYITSWPQAFESSPSSKRCQLLEHLHSVLGYLKEDVWQKHFLTVLPLLHDLLSKYAGESDLIAGVLVCFADLLRLRPGQMRQFPELSVVTLFDVQHNSSKIVSDAREKCALLIVRVFPCEVLGKILCPIIAHQEVPSESVAAVRLFTLMCQETENPESLVPVLPAIIPLLVQAYENSEESTMRKECVYGLIYAELCVGEELMTPYYKNLSASKIRLMSVYMKRAIQSNT
ncbi:CLIP-associating protein 1 [Hypsibius exemplaris]|uniref:CLIP-associating protein 1 n=1 Tax=Hypsibius exemplaris TaxID=2072580 RepID=A0A1W0X2I2_HYPEX|nr:CLIP-associating protein 1 [Hypsibius exemplaris]